MFKRATWLTVGFGLGVGATVAGARAVKKQVDRYQPNAVVERAKTTIIDTVGAMTFGADLPWSRIIIEYVQRTSAPGRGSIVGTPHKARGQLAALANGALAHSFELDSLCNPGVGFHPGAALTSPGIPV